MTCSSQSEKYSTLTGQQQREPLLALQDAPAPAPKPFQITPNPQSQPLTANDPLTLFLVPNPNQNPHLLTSHLQLILRYPLYHHHFFLLILLVHSSRHHPHQSFPKHRLFATAIVFLTFRS